MYSWSVCFMAALFLTKRGKLHEVLLQWTRQYGPIFKFYFGREPVVVVSDPELVFQVCIKQFKNFHDRPEPIVQPFMGRVGTFQTSSMLFAQGKLWAGLRAACEPLFHSNALHAVWRFIIAWLKYPGMLDVAVASGFLWGASQALLDSARRRCLEAARRCQERYASGRSTRSCQQQQQQQQQKQLQRSSNQ
ncbi:hypothetical protein WJX72_005965 [[Myrmecia] bisecta]|uniref:Cytochrome P450 n=1 Tax=[Myrmecia] bisecta TaxID=41462 RepID=A0AAW1R6T0_9CHLO